MLKKIVIVILMCAMSVIASHGFAENENKVALVMKALSNPFFLKMQEGAKTYAEKNGVPFEVFGIERETEVERQIGIVENLITRGYGAIVIAPADSKQLVPVCKKALEQGIVVINIDNPLHQETLAEHQLSIPFVGSDNKAGAAMVGRYLKQKIGETGRVLVIEGIRGVENAELRKQGFIEAVTADTQIEVAASETANWHTDEAFSVTTNLLEQYGPVHGIFCANDNMALGAIQALDMLGMAGQVWVGAYDNLEEARVEMRNQRMHATIEQHPELMGEYGVALAVKALAGQTPPAYTATPLDLITYEGFGQTIGLSISDLANPFFASLQQGAQKAADLFGVQLTVVDAGNDDAKQLLDLQAFLETPVSAMIVNPTNADAVAPAVEIASSMGIAVITVDRKASPEDLVLSHIASDNVAGGRMAAEFLAAQLGQAGNILEMEGIPGTSAAHDRGAGFNEVINQYPDLSISTRAVGDFSREKAKDVMQRLLQQGIEVKAVFAHNDAMILGVIDAYQDAQIAMPQVLVGFDAVPEALEAITQGRLSATIAQKPEAMGWQAVKSTVEALRGDPLPPAIFVDLELVTQ